VKADGVSAAQTGAVEPAPGGPATDPAGDRLDLAIARLLSVGTYLGIVLLVAGFGLMLLVGRSPFDSPPPFNAGQLPGDLGAGRPEGALWLGLLVLVATPSARVAASLIGYRRAGERGMVAVSAAILVVVAAGVLIGVVLGETAG
jgi:uncharacterized membrane protein